ncbi:MAG TPA: DMT family transporter, partial [Candidatus Saccharimonadales bacterium]|nr:DMT family transporter [Candidatus Saccharimonadales bacterium]
PMTAILGFIVLREKVTVQKIAFVLLGFIGVAFIAVKDYSQVFIWGHGEVLALISSIFFALSYITRKWQGSLLNNKEIAVIIFFISTLLLFFTSVIIFHEPLPKSSVWDVTTILVILGAGLFNVINLFLTNYGFQKVDAVLGSNLLMLEVVFAVILGFLFYFEIPNLKECIGGALIVLSAYWMNKTEN